MAGVYTVLAGACPPQNPDAIQGGVASPMTRGLLGRDLTAWLAEVTNGAAELAHRLGEAEAEGIGDDGVADRHFLQVWQGLHQGRKVDAGEVMPGIEADTDRSGGLAGGRHLVEFVSRLGRAAGAA